MSVPYLCSGHVRYSDYGHKVNFVEGNSLWGEDKGRKFGLLNSLMRTQVWGMQPGKRASETVNIHSQICTCYAVLCMSRIRTHTHKHSRSQFFSPSFNTLGTLFALSGAKRAFRASRQADEGNSCLNRSYKMSHQTSCTSHSFIPTFTIRMSLDLSLFFSDDVTCWNFFTRSATLKHKVFTLSPILEYFPQQTRCWRAFLQKHILCICRRAWVGDKMSKNDLSMCDRQKEAGV